MRGSFGNRISDDFESQEAERKELSALLLSHCLLYKSSFVSNYNQASNLHSLSSAAYIAPTELAGVYHRITNTGLPLSAPISCGKIDQFLNSANAKIDTPNELLWIHLASTDILPKIVSHYKIEKILIKTFLNKAPKTLISKPLMNGIPGVYINLVSLAQVDGVSTVKILHAYCNQGLFITLEDQSHAIISDGFYSIDGVTNPLSIKERRLSTTGEAVTQKSALVSAPTLSRSNTLTGINDIVDIEANNKFENEAETFFDLLSSNLNRPDMQEQICSAPNYILYEAIYCLLKMSYKIIDFYSDRLLLLHDSVFVREHKPTYTEGNILTDRLDTITEFVCLMRFTVEQSLHCLKDNQKKLGLTDAVSSELISSFSYVVLSTDRMQKELSRIDKCLKDLIGRRNDRINLMLSMSATLLLPLSFLTGIFGMNFTGEGGLHRLEMADYGSFTFWILSMFIIVWIMWFFRREGFFDMLRMKELNKHTSYFSNQRNIIKKK